ncbi:MAG: exodeoxyribonuclease III [Elusimicrobia bacterium]|nr:exodeoxyribonuclease III [Elusimicrobiota bacterium]
MKLISWNVNGLRAVYKKNFLTWFETQNADIIALQETKADLSQLPNELKEISGYNFYISTPQKKGYSGVCIWSKQKPLSVSYSIENDRFDSEGRIVALEFEKFWFYNVYFPNGGASPERLKYKLDFYDYFFDYVFKKTPAPKGHNAPRGLVICGDYNTAHTEIDLARPKENSKVSGFLPEERLKLDHIVSKGLTDTFRHFHLSPDNYTWWDYKTAARTRNVGWRIDYFFVNQPVLKYLKSASIQKDVLGSDHCPVEIEIY